MNEKEKCNVTEIALALGLSPTTVSRALSGKGRVSEKTRLMVADYIADRKLVPHVRTSRFSDKKTMNVCITLPIEEDYAELPFFIKILMVLYDFFIVRGYNCLVVRTGQDNIFALQNVIRRHKVDGVVLTRLPEYSGEIGYLKEKGVPFVVTGACPDESVHQADVDNRSACRELTNVLFKMGIRKTALMCSDLRQTVMQARLNGYKDGLRDNDIALERRWIIENAADRNVIEKAVGDILKEQIECIICSDDGICVSVLNHLREIGVAVPRDIRVASFYNSRLLEEYDSSITSIDYNIAEMGKVAGGMLVRLMNNESCEMKKVLGYQILLKESTKLMV